MRDHPLHTVLARQNEYTSARELCESSMRTAQSIAVRIKTLLPDHLILVTDSLPPERWAEALDVHENMKNIPINVIAFDANKSDSRLLSDLAKRTKGIFQSLSPNEFMQ